MKKFKFNFNLEDFCYYVICAILFALFVWTMAMGFYYCSIQ